MVKWISPEAFKNYAETLAVIVGGGWALWLFCIRRVRETTLDISLTPQSVPRDDGRFVVFLDAAFSNRSAVRLTAKRLRYNKASETPVYAYTDPFEKLKFSGSLLLRTIPADAPKGAQIPWFSGAPNDSPREGDLEIDLLDEYEIGGKTDFWMEPSECYHCGVTIVLDPGLYVAMVTFIGSASKDQEFWRRIFVFRVPSESPKPNDTKLANA